jgi:hypothetical protein
MTNITFVHGFKLPRREIKDSWATLFGDSSSLAREDLCKRLDLFMTNPAGIQTNSTILFEDPDHTYLILGIPIARISVGQDVEYKNLTKAIPQTSAVFRKAWLSVACAKDSYHNEMGVYCVTH